MTNTPTPSDDERMQRVRVGATGLAAVMLTILVATAVASSVRSHADSISVAAGNSTAVGNAADPAEPLAQLGAAPASENGKKASTR